jgi:hypothetical protein
MVDEKMAIEAQPCEIRRDIVLPVAILVMDLQHASILGTAHLATSMRHSSRKDAAVG